MADVNEPPEKPTVVGPKVGLANRLHDFTFNSSDPEGHDLYYRISWGDDDIENYAGPYSPGETVTFSHSWSGNGSFAIVAIVKDQYESKSPQTQFNFLVIKNRVLTNPMLVRFLEKIMERLPLIGYLFFNISISFSLHLLSFIFHDNDFKYNSYFLSR